MRLIVLFAFIAAARGFLQGTGVRTRSSHVKMQGDGLKIDMRGKTVFVAGVADSTGYGWAIAKACAEAGAKIVLGTWPPVLPIFQMGLERGQFVEDQKLSNGQTMDIAKIYPLDATFDTKELIPEEVAKGKRYKVRRCRLPRDLSRVVTSSRPHARPRLGLQSAWRSAAPTQSPRAAIDADTSTHSTPTGSPPLPQCKHPPHYPSSHALFHARPSPATRSRK